MILIFGGAHQSKLDYAKENYNVDTIWDCSAEVGNRTDGAQGDGREPDFAKDIIYAIDRFVLQCVQDGREAADFFKENREKWQDKILIATDVSQGIVPTDATQRAFREMNGRLLLYLAKEAEEVVRVFCGIGKKVK